jgi:hypothetical protein
MITHNYLSANGEALITKQTKLQSPPMAAALHRHALTGKGIRPAAQLLHPQLSGTAAQSLCIVQTCKTCASQRSQHLILVVRTLRLTVGASKGWVHQRKAFRVLPRPEQIRVLTAMLKLQAASHTDAYRARQWLERQSAGNDVQ